MNTYDELGVKAIIALQELVGIEEPPDKALRAWRSMDPWQREQTLLAHDACAKKSGPSAERIATARNRRKGG